MKIHLFSVFKKLFGQEKLLFIFISKKLIKLTGLNVTDLYLKNIRNLKKNNSDLKEKNSNIEKEENLDNNQDKCKSDSIIITDGFCS